MNLVRVGGDELLRLFFVAFIVVFLILTTVHATRMIKNVV